MIAPTHGPVAHAILRAADLETHRLTTATFPVKAIANADHARVAGRLKAFFGYARSLHEEWERRKVELKT